ncbi:MAG: hypothetical protein WBD09_05745 [Halobacteriota archaeon]
MRFETKKAIAWVFMVLLTFWTFICFIEGMASVLSAKSTLNYDYIFMTLLTGILSGLLAILSYIFLRMEAE